MCPNINLRKMIIWKENIITQMAQAVGGGKAQHKSLSKAPAVYLLNREKRLGRAARWLGK